MKDKSRFLSSVIVSLLAGFIYYILGQNVSDNVVSSVKAVLSSDFSEEYMPSDCITLNSDVNISGNKLSKKNSFKKNRTFELKEIIITLPVESMFSDVGKNSQAKIQKPSPDRNVDFTTELNRLINKDRTEINIKPGKENRIKKNLSNTDQETADLDFKVYRSKQLGKNIGRSQMKFYNKDYKGNGFEFNYVVSSVAKEPVKKTRPNTNSDKVKKECSEYNFNFEMNTSVKKVEKVDKVRKVRIIAPEIRIKINEEDEDTGIEPEEINVDDSTSEDSM